MDDITLNTGSGGDSIRALEDTDGKKWPVGVTAFATTVGTPDVPAIVTPTTGLPVRLADGSGYLSTLPVSLASVPSHAVTGPLTDTELRASAVPVSGTFWQATQPVSIAATVTVSGTVDLGATDNAVLDAIAASVASTDTKTPALGQALAAGSVPVVLTAAQITTLTPPAAITGFATETTLSTLNGKVTACNTGAVVLAAGTAAIGKLAANDGVDIGDVTINNASLAVTGTFWQATQPVSIASAVAVTDNGGSLTVDNGGTFAVQVSSALPAGTNAIGKLAANSGVDIGDVDVTSVIPGTGATNLGKQKDTVVGSSDVGVAALARLRYTAGHSSGSDGSYDTLDLTSWHELRVRDQRARDIQNCNNAADFTALNNDTTGIADSANHVFGTGAVTFNKVNGSANTVFGAIAATISSLNITDIFEDGAFVGMAMYLPSLSNLSYAFIRLGTDASNYNEWRWPVADLTASTWISLRKPTAQPATYAGNGWDSTAITYVCLGVAMGAETDTLAGVVVDHVHFVGGRVTDTITNASITSSVTTPNVNLNRVGGTATDTNSGNKSAGTLRVVLATDQPALTTAMPVSLASVPSHAVTNAGTFAVQVDGAALTSLQLLDDAVATTGSAITTKGFAVSGTDGTNARVLKTDSSGELQVDVLTLPTLANVTTVGTVSSVTAIANALPAGNNNIGDVDVASIAAGTNYIGRVRLTDGATDADVFDLPNANVVPVALVDADGDQLTSFSVVQNSASGLNATVVGNSAHDASDSGNAVKVGARAAATLSDDTPVANGDRTDNVSDLDGAVVVRPQFPLGDLISEAVSDTGGSSTAFTNFGATASTRNYVTAIHVFRTDAGTSVAYVDFRDGTGGSVLYRAAIPPNGGAVITLGGTPLFRTSANTALAFDVSAALTTVYITVSGFKSKV